ncbi:MAG: regulatory protein RecX [candidate division Zixibacteria bacterium]|nr:regulatory protein RecX [candidate division Zixibacteria bacterium]
MIVLTSLSPHPARPGRVRVYIDGKYAFELSKKIIRAKNVVEGETLSAERRRELETFAVREAAISLLARRERSRAELAVALKRKRFAPDLIERVLQEIAAQGLQSDSRFAGAWVETRKRLSPRGRAALIYELKQKGIAGPEIKGAVNRYTQSDERAALRDLIASRLERLGASKDDKQKIKHRLLGFLARRGFAYDDIHDVLVHEFPDWA